MAVSPFTYVAHLLAVAAAVLILVWSIHFRGGLALNSTNKSLIFNVHPVMMLIGIIILGGEATMSYRALPGSRDARKRVHLMLHGVALVLGAVGIYAVFKYHKESNISNMYSLHSWVGLGTFCLYGIQWIMGFVTFFFPGASASTRQSMVPWHAIFGLFIYILAVGTAQLGFIEKLTFLQLYNKLGKYGSEALLVNFMALVVIFLGAAVVLSTVNFKTTRLESQKSIGL
ncbi:putative ascorbate-specific transmembrane electron transporter 1 [Carex littledalei]|uniref:Putative ascorbate-specific transmembrane electron transporter 1 n=1 Tax=Carex littledalei TaxID=544730 RepID=A0A833QZ44_9POAL|nr:putative ascorbate-specific transmembrane electron transporter 1 [Carex littledalei]